MKILGIDSSTDILAVGLAGNGSIIDEETLTSEREHASRIFGIIDDVLTRNNCKLQVLDGLAVALGPGSFTGLRVGMAVAKGMATALGKSLAAISTFEIVGEAVRKEYREFYLTALVRKGEFYIYSHDVEKHISQRFQLVNEDSLVKTVGKTPVGIIGRRPEGWPLQLPEIIRDDVTAISGGRLALAAESRIKSGQTADIAALEPLYIAPSQAELKFGGR